MHGMNTDLRPESQALAWASLSGQTGGLRTRWPSWPIRKQAGRRGGEAWKVLEGQALPHGGSTVPERLGLDFTQALALL